MEPSLRLSDRLASFLLIALRGVSVWHARSFMPYPIEGALLFVPHLVPDRACSSKVSKDRCRGVCKDPPAAPMKAGRRCPRVAMPPPWRVNSINQNGCGTFINLSNLLPLTQSFETHTAPLPSPAAAADRDAFQHPESVCQIPSNTELTVGLLPHRLGSTPGGGRVASNIQASFSASR